MVKEISLASLKSIVTHFTKYSSLLKSSLIFTALKMLIPALSIKLSLDRDSDQYLHRVVATPER